MTEPDDLPGCKGKWLDESGKLRGGVPVRALEADSHLRAVEVC